MTKNRERKALKKPRLRIPPFPIEVKRRLIKAVLTLLAALLTFGGPTYLIYALRRFALPYALLTLLGLASFATGIILFTHLIKEEGKAGAPT